MTLYLLDAIGSAGETYIVTFFGTTCKSFLLYSQGLLKLWTTREPNLEHGRELLLHNWSTE